MIQKITVLGIGNLLMGDEGVGIRVVQHLEETCPVPDVEYIDGGTGGLQLLDIFTRSGLVVIIDASLDGKPPGTVTQLEPKYSKDYPRTLVSHDIGLKDLLDAAWLLDRKTRTLLFTISIAAIEGPSLDLSPEVQAAIQPAADQVCRFLQSLKP